jgi:hypothetical protein
MPDRRLRPGEGSPVGGDSQYRHHCRCDAFNALGKALGSSDELLRGEFVCACRRSRNEGGDAQAPLKQMCQVFGKRGAWAASLNEVPVFVGRFRGAGRVLGSGP